MVVYKGIMLTKYLFGEFSKVFININLTQKPFVLQNVQFAHIVPEIEKIALTYVTLKRTQRSNLRNAMSLK